MADTGTSHSNKRVNRAGRFLRDDLTDCEVDELVDAIEAVDWWRSLHARPLAKVNANLRYYIRKADVEPQVTQRLKRFVTIVDKLRRQSTMALTTMEDIGGVRAILPQQSQVDKVVADICERWTIRRVREYVDGRDPGPKPDGYRAVHVVVVKDRRHIEVQLRTPWQDTWAQSVEQDTRRLAQGLKFGAGPDDLREYYQLISEYLALREQHETPNQEFMQDLAKLYNATRRYFPEQTT
jgi:putative GTP pyrophosphokinase